MAGTVWEWCLNKYDNPEIIESRDDDFDRRVLRGGSRSDESQFVRSSDRAGFTPYYRNYGVGFRLARTL